MIQEKIFGNIGLNLDDDPRYFGADDTDRIQNMLPDVDGAAGLLETHPGVFEIPSTLSYSGDIRVIGSCKDPKANYLYYFVKSLDDPSNGNTIIQFDPVIESFRTIVFEEDYLLMGDYVYGAVIFGDYLIYNTLSDGLYKVNITYANRYYNTEVWAAGVYGVDEVVRRPDGTCWLCIQETTVGEGAPETEPDYWTFEYYTYPTITATTFVLRNMPPVDRPTIAYGTDGSKVQNNIKGKTFQFACRYKYLDGGYSVYSPFSEPALPQTPEEWDGDLIGQTALNNTITIGFVRGDLSVIESVEVIVKDGSAGDWRFFEEVKEDVSSINFYNDEKYESVDQDEVLKAEDAIPRACADMALINENRIIASRITEGFDNIDLDVYIVPKRVSVSIITPASPILGDVISIIPQGVPALLGAALNTSDIDMADGYAAGDIMTLIGSVAGNAFSVSYTLIADNVIDKAALITAIQSQLGAIMSPYVSYIKILTAIDPAAAWNTNVNTNNTDDIEIGAIAPDDFIDGTISFIDQTSATEGLNKWNTYKSGSTHPHGIEYFDAEFRRSTVQRNAACSVVVPDRNAYGSDFSYRICLQWRIAHAAPAWASYWRWVYAGNKHQSSFVQYVISGTNGAMAAPYDNYLGLDITPLQELKTSSAPDTSIPSSIIDPYVFVEGDRVRILTEAAAVGGYGLALTGADFYDLPILGVNGNYILVSLPAAGTYGADVGSLIEIYSPRSFEEGAEIYFSVGPINQVSSGLHLNSDSVNGGSQGLAITITGTANNGSGYVRFATDVAHGLVAGDWVRIAGTTDHDGDWEITLASDGTHFDIFDAYNAPSQAGTATPIAYGILESGDAYLIGRAFSETLSGGAAGDLLPVESMHWSDFYISDHYDVGRTNIYSSIGEVTQNNVRWGLKYLYGSSLNNIFTFDPLDYKTTTDVYGDLERIGEMGDVLKLIFNHKVAGMYIGKTEYIDTQGSSVLAVSDSVLSNPNYSVDDYGTTVPQSVLFVNGRCYFVDLYNGCIVRNSANGSSSISGTADVTEDGRDYKMNNYFRSICAAVIDEGEENSNILLGWDNKRKLLYVSILHPNIEQRTLAFRESRGRWVAFLDFCNEANTLYPTCYEWIGDQFYSFLDGSDSVWDHDSTTAVPLTIYGELKTPYVSVWGVLNPNHIKVFDSIAIHTNNKNWTGYVYIPVSLSYPHGMESRLPAANFRVREGVLHAPYMFNGKSLGNTFSLLGLHNGESLRGYVIQNLLTVSGAAKLFKVDINSRISKV